MKEHEITVQKEVRAKIDTLNVQKKAVLKFAYIVGVHKSKWTLILTKRSAHVAWLL